MTAIFHYSQRLRTRDALIYFAEPTEVGTMQWSINILRELEYAERIVKRVQLEPLGLIAFRVVTLGI